ncbi:MAG: aminotransferase class V-fold PLP-dependent enzyme [Planctomycetales bacterium]|nr:aminotransferase class V-fold PLP-dependent enzyme [Planctomycetales bacterium]
MACVNSQQPSYVVDWPRPLPEVQAALQRAFASGDWGRYAGQECEQLATLLANMHGNQDVHLCSSGTLAVELALRGLGVNAGDEVVLAAYDFPGNFRAIEAIGALPVLVDIQPDGWSYAPEQLERAISPQTVAIIVSHLHGNVAPIAELCATAHRAGVRVVEDACQMPGGSIGGRVLGTFGDASVLSFGGSKLLTAGRGGAVLSHDPLVMQRIRVFAERGNDAFALSELQAAVLPCQLERLALDNQIRQARANYLRSLLIDVAAIRFSSLPDNSLPSYYKFGFRLNADPQQSEMTTARQQLLNRFDERKIPIGAGFRGFVQRSRRRCRAVSDLIEARRAASDTLLLHHPVLLCPANVIEELAMAIRACF